MRSVITDSVVLPCSAQELYDSYLDPARHAAITGHHVEISAELGAPFEAFNGMLSGKIVYLISGKLIVQSWRSVKFHDKDPDSTLVLMFSSEDGNGRIDLVHLDVPEHDYDEVVAGWKTHYWQPWREYLA